LLAFLKGKPLAEVTLSDLEAWIARPRVGRAGGGLGADSTRAKDVDLCRGLWRWAIAHGYLVHDPTADLERPKVRNEAPRAVKPELWAGFWGSPTLSDVERVVYGLQFFTGLRRMEVCHLRPEHVNATDGLLEGFKRKGDRNSKTTGKLPFVSCALLFAQKHPSLLPEAGAFVEPLRRLSEDRKGHAFLIPWGEEAVADPRSWRNGVRPVQPEGMTSPDQINNRLLTILGRAGLPERAFSPHALRHGFVTYLLRAGVPLEVVSRLANHSSLDITLRYLSAPEDPLADFLDPPVPTKPKLTRWGFT
jgi:site-specific recombinase XerD